MIETNITLQQIFCDLLIYSTSEELSVKFDISEDNCRMLANGDYVPDYATFYRALSVFEQMVEISLDDLKNIHARDFKKYLEGIEERKEDRRTREYLRQGISTKELLEIYKMLDKTDGINYIIIEDLLKLVEIIRKG